jgi:DNA-directed RNA polymerase subunit M/transcription elongation factor TFIIS
MFRDTGKEALGLYLKNAKNIEAFDKLIYEISEDNEDKYNEILLEVISYIAEKKSLKEIVEILQDEEIGYDSEHFDDIRFLQEEQDNFIIKPFEIEEGVLECGKCGSKKTFSYSKQTRGGDEGTTVFAECANCGNRWKM